MAKHYKYVNGKRLIVVNNYELGTDVIPEEVNLIPDITQADEGKVLMADENGEPKWTSIPSQLPTLTGNGGKVLKVNSGATGVEWDDESAELPSLTGNADKVLKVNSGATGVEWAEAGGMTLYGPYIAKGPDEVVTFESGSNIQSIITLDTIQDYRTYESVLLPLENAVYLMAGVDVPGLLTYAGNTFPMFYDDGEEQSVTDYEIAITNQTASDISIYGYQLGIIFYSSVELPVVQPEGE